MKYYYGLAFVPVVFALSVCGKKKDDPATPPGGGETNAVLLDFTKHAANSLPQIATTGPSSTSLAASITPASTGSAAYILNLAKFFKQECYMPMGSDNEWGGFCPNSVKEEYDAAISGGDGVAEGSEFFSKYKLSSGTLIGLIYHAQMYGNVGANSNDCAASGGTDLTTPNHPNFINVQDATGVPGKFVVHYPTGSPLFSCVKTNQWDNQAATYSTFGFAENSTNVLTARYGQPYGDIPDQQTDIFQVYLSFVPDTETTKPLFLAFNHPSAQGTRAIVLTNLVEHKFAVKYRMGNSEVVSVGVGGVDATSGEPVPGHYIARVVGSESDAGVYCVNNGTGEYTTFSDEDSCGDDASLSAAWSTMNPETVASFLEMGVADKAAAVNYLAFFGDNTEAFSEEGDQPRDNNGTLSCSGSETYPCYVENKKDFPTEIQ